MPDRYSWRAEHEAWKQADAAFKASAEQKDPAMRAHAREYYKVHRHHLMPAPLDGRLTRMLRRIISNARLVTSLERTAEVAPEWMGQVHGRLRYARRTLVDAVRTLRRHIRRAADHAKGGLYGRTEEFSPYLRAFLKGEMDDVEFTKQMDWALRMLTRAAGQEAEGQRERTFTLEE
jgi:hypothetical protein